MKQKTILITGSTAGIGLAGAQTLGRQGWRVLVHARTAERGRPVLESLRRQVPQGSFDLVTGDLAGLEQVVGLAGQVEERVKVLDVLWNNAGVFLTEAKGSPQGWESQWAVNHLAPFLLTSRLLPLVRAAEGGRIVQTSSFAHWWGRPVTDFRPPEGRYVPLAVYADTKLANVLFVRELAQRLASSAITVHAFHPGYVRTGIGGNGDPGRSNARSPLAFLMVTPERGAETGVHLATSPEAALRSGLYWSNRKVRRTSGRSTPENAARLWERSEAAVREYSGR